MEMPKTRYGWHILTYSGRLQYGDGRKPRRNQRLRYRGRKQPSACIQGMHAAPTLADASYWHHFYLYLVHAPHQPNRKIITFVRLEGIVQIEQNKMVGTYRTILWGLTVEQALRAYGSTHDELRPPSYEALQDFLLDRAYEEGLETGGFRP